NISPHGIARGRRGSGVRQNQRSFTSMSSTPDLKFIHDTFPEPVMPACSVQKLLRGQKALVTGASSGIGKAVAIALGHAGADVLVNYVSGPDDAEAVAEEIRRCGSKALTVRADVS